MNCFFVSQQVIEIEQKILQGKIKIEFRIYYL